MGNKETKKTENPAKNEKEEIKKIKKEIKKTGPFIGYALTEKKYLYLYDIPTKTGERYFLDIEKPHGCDDLIVGNFYYMIGGIDSFKVVYSIDLKQNFISKRLADLNIGRYYSNSTTVDNFRVYTVGGRSYDGSLKSCEVYDPIKNKWAILANLNEPRECVTLGCTNNLYQNKKSMNKRYIYALEGRNAHGFIKSVERFDVLDEESGWILYQIDLLKYGMQSKDRKAMGGCWCIQKSMADFLVVGGTRFFSDGDGKTDIFIYDTQFNKMTNYGVKLEKGLEMYSPAVIYNKCYYQLAYCYQTPKYHLVMYRPKTGKVEIKESHFVWRKYSE